jgi:hypothetical protein
VNRGARAAALLALACWVTCHASAGPRVRVRHGLGGRWWSGPCPVSVEVVLEAGRLDGALTWAGDAAHWTARHVMPLRVTGPARKVFRFLHPETSPGTPPLEWNGEPVTDAVVETRMDGLVSTRHMVGVIGEAPGYAAAESAETADSTGIALTIAAIAPHELPESVLGFGPLRVLVLRGRAAAALDAGQARAVREWVRLGGHLLVSPGVPPAPLRDVAWVAELAKVRVGAPRVFAAGEVEDELGLRIDGPSVPGIEIAAEGDGATTRRGISVTRKLGRGHVEVIGVDETSLGNGALLRSFLMRRLTSFEMIAKPMFGDPLEMELMRLAQQSWAAQHDPLLAGALIVWGLAVLALMRPARARGRYARHPVARVLFWPALGLAMSAAIWARKPAEEAARTEVYALIEAGSESDVASGEAILATRGTAGRVARVALAGAHAQPMGRADRRGGLRFFYASPGTYDVEVGGEVAIDGPRFADGLPVLFDVSTIVEIGGTWTAELRARDKVTLEGWIRNGTRLPLEAGYLIAEGAICALPRVESGATLNGPFKMEHPNMAAPPADAGASLDAIVATVRRYIRYQSFPTEGLTALPQISLMVAGRMGVPGDAYVPSGARALTMGAFWLPTQARATVTR